MQEFKTGMLISDSEWYERSRCDESNLTGSLKQPPKRKTRGPKRLFSGKTPATPRSSKTKPALNEAVAAGPV